MGGDPHVVRKKHPIFGCFFLLLRMTKLYEKFTFNNVILRERLSATVSIPYSKQVIILKSVAGATR